MLIKTIDYRVTYEHCGRRFSGGGKPAAAKDDPATSHIYSDLFELLILFIDLHGIMVSRQIDGRKLKYSIKNLLVVR